MLENTFCHLPGINSRTETRLWGEGCLSWEDLLGASPALLRNAAAVIPEVHRSAAELLRREPAYFSRLLPSRERWRLFPAFRDTVAYLDIETTGLGREDHITTVALYDGRHIRTYVHGENLDDFPADVARCGMFVTYNGTSFDIPFLERHFGMKLAQPHLDLMYLLRSLGITGGMKGCERALGIGREDVAGVDGFLAILLWREYLKTGHRAPLDTLLAYNIADAVNLEMLLVLAYNLKIEQTPFAASHRLSLPEAPSSPFTACRETVRRLQRSCF